MVRRVLPCIFAALVGCRCHREHAAEASDRHPEASDRWLMQSYDVPADDAVALLSQLKDLFVISKGDKDGSYSQIARASLAPDGKLVVVGDSEIQKGVEGLIAGMAGHHATPRTITVTYWLVTGRPAKGEVALPPDLKPVADALQEVSKQTGPQEFALWEHLQLVSNGAQGFLQGRHATIHLDAVVDGNKVLLTTKIAASHLSDHMFGPNNIDTKLEISPDQTVVLAQTGFNPSEPISAPSGNDPPVSLYYLVKASVLNADSRPR